MTMKHARQKAQLPKQPLLSNHGAASETHHCFKCYMFLFDFSFVVVSSALLGEAAVPAAPPPLAKGPSLLKSVSDVIGDMDKPWAQLGGLELDPVTAREVEKHRKKSLEHLRSLERIQVELQKAQLGRTSKARPLPRKTEDKPAEKMGVCGSTAKYGPHLPQTLFYMIEFYRPDCSGLCLACTRWRPQR